MLWEQEAADSLGLDWTTMLIRPTGVNGPRNRVLHEIDVPSPGYDTRTWVAFRRRFYALLERLDPAPDVLLLRYNVHDPFLARFVNTRSNVVTVHHAVESSELAARGDRAAPVKRALERRLGRMTLNHVAGIVGVTQEILDYEVARRVGNSPPTFVYPNGRLVDDPALLDRRHGIRLAFVASEFASWMGLEDLLHALLDHSGEVTLDVVGPLSEAQRDLCARDSRVRPLGVLGQIELGELLEEASVGVATLRVDRKGLKQSCTLKVRDYLAAGVPVVSGHDDVFPDDFPYYRRTGTDIDAILAAAHEWRSVDRVTVREAARPHIDKVELVRRLHGELVAAFASADD